MKYKVLFVDDEPENLRLLERLFRRTHDVFQATSGAEGIKMLELHDIELIISDQRMPGMTGIEFLKRAAEMRPNTVRMILTGYTDVNDLVDVINSGVVYKYITKPWVNEDLVQTVARGLEHYEAFKGRHDFAQQKKRLEAQVERTTKGFVRMITEALRAGDVDFPARCQRIEDLASALGQWMNMDAEALTRLAIAVQLCEIGRLGPKRGSSLTTSAGEQQQLLRANVFWADLLDAVPEMSDIALAVRFQYENFDGSGFPDQRAGEGIPLFARILAVARAYDSLACDETGAELSVDDALNRLEMDAGSRFDPKLVVALKGVCAMRSSDSDFMVLLPQDHGIDAIV